MSEDRFLPYIEKHLHRHGQRTFLGVLTGERQPCDIQRMRECAKRLCPNHTEVSRSSVVNFGENSIEDVTE